MNHEAFEDSESLREAKMQDYNSQESRDSASPQPLAAAPPPARRRSWLQAGLLAAVLVVAMVSGGLIATRVGDSGGGVSGSGDAARSTVQVADVKAQTGSAAVNAAVAIDNLPELVRNVRDSVVTINTVLTSRTGARSGEGLGTGIVFDKQGYILTNYHVVQGANSVSVKFFDGTQVAGRVIGSDPGNDLAVIEVSVPAETLKPVTFANSDQVAVGESVFAIGAPFGLEFTVTSGIVSGTERESTGGISGRPVRGVIQTDAAVNPGNSGGPLFNADGNVIGVNASIENPTGQRVFVGVGFAIPANTARRFIPDMIAGRPITHAQLGVAGVTLNAVNAREAGVNVQRGIYITSVTPGGAAERAGLRAAPASATGSLPPGGDIVTAIDGREVSTIQELARIVDSKNVGDTVKLKIVRGGNTMELSATLREWTGS